MMPHNSNYTNNCQEPLPSAADGGGGEGGAPGKSSLNEKGKCQTWYPLTLRSKDPSLSEVDHGPCISLPQLERNQGVPVGVGMLWKTYPLALNSGP